MLASEKQERREFLARHRGAQHRLALLAGVGDSAMSLWITDRQPSAPLDEDVPALFAQLKDDLSRDHHRPQSVIHEKHFPVDYWAGRWGYSEAVVRKWALDDGGPGILIHTSESPSGKRTYISVRISESAAERIYRQHIMTYEEKRREEVAKRRGKKSLSADSDGKFEGVRCAVHLLLIFGYKFGVILFGCAD